MTFRLEIVTALAVLLVGGSLALAKEPQGQSGISAELLLAETFAGDPSKEVNVQLYTFAPGAATSWHIHPGAHEIAYVVEGTFTFRQEGKEPVTLRTGEAEYLAPDVVHRGMNEGNIPVKLFVVRIKPREKPLAEDVPPPR